MELIKKINKLIHDKNIVIIFFLFLAVHILSTLVFYCMSKDVAIAQNPLEKKTEFEKILIILIIAPIIETLTLNLLPIKIFKKIIKSNLITIILTSSIFAFMHYYSFLSILKSFVSGIIYNGFFLVVETKYQVLIKAILLTILLHSFYNLFGFLIIEKLNLL
jgi:membrane protease YdiL (CAAX protease family)